MVCYRTQRYAPIDDTMYQYQMVDYQNIRARVCLLILVAWNTAARGHDLDL